MTGDPAEDRVDPCLQRRAVARIRQLVQDIEHQRLGIDLTQNGRGFPHRHRATAEGFDGQAKRLKVLGEFFQARAIAGAQLDDLGDQQGLRGDAVFGHLRLQLFIDQPLMGCVLIDQNHAALGLGHDVVLVHLRPRRAQRKALQPGRIRGRIDQVGLRFVAGRGHFPEPLERRGSLRRLPLVGRHPRRGRGAIHLVDPRWTNRSSPRRTIAHRFRPHGT